MPKNILHMLTPHKHVSPFDVNQALDAGYDSVTPYEEVTIEEVADLVQDVIFSRPPDHGTASDIAAKGVARPDSFLAAIETAAVMAERSGDTMTMRPR